MEKIWAGIDKIGYAAGYLGGWVLLGIIGLTMVEVITRYVLNNPLILCDEFGGYSLFAITFLGLAYCGREKGHIRITFIVERISKKTASRLRIFTLVLALIFVSVAAKVSWEFLVKSFVRGIRSNSWLMTPLGWPQLAMPIGFTLFTAILIMQIAKAIKAHKAGSEVEEGGAKEEY
jgi:TRAP-type C4-dicarboxylate transport system permease small subunit